MKRSIKLFSLLIGVIIFASACAGRTCPTYANNDAPENNDKTEQAV